jgi:hypothetical protein
MYYERVQPTQKLSYARIYGTGFTDPIWLGEVQVSNFHTIRLGVYSLAIPLPAHLSVTQTGAILPIARAL